MRILRLIIFFFNFSFFKDKAYIERVSLDKPQIDTRSCRVELENLAETPKALKMNDEVVRVEASAENFGPMSSLSARETIGKGLEKEATRREL